jgi:hypothetical protein
MMDLSQLNRLNLGSMLPGHRIKFYYLIECDRLYPLTDVNDKISMVILSNYIDKIH